MVAGAQPGPGSQVRGVGEVFADIGADFGDDRGGGQRTDARGGGQQVPGGAKGDHHRLDLGVQPREHRLQVVNVV